MYSYGNNAQTRTTQRNGEDNVGNINGLLQDESGGDSKSILSSLMDKGRTPMALIQVDKVKIDFSIYSLNIYYSCRLLTLNLYANSFFFHLTGGFSVHTLGTILE